MAKVTRTCTVTFIKTNDDSVIKCEPSNAKAIIGVLGDSYKEQYTSDVKMEMSLSDFITMANTAE